MQSSPSVAMTSSASQAGKSELLIKVDDYNPFHTSNTFTAGQLVKGKVIYIIRKEQEDLRDVSIEFYGKVETAITVRNGNSSRRETEHILLFHFREALYNKSFTFKAQTLSWPFEFRIPQDASYVRRDDSHPAYLRSGSRPLPPSYYHETGSFGKNGAGYIKYKLKAYVNSNKAFGSKKAEIPINLRRLPDVRSPEDQAIETRKFPRTSWQSRSLRGHKHTLSQKFAHVFTNDPQLRNPSINFDATLKLPSVTSRRMRGDLVLTIKQVFEGQTDPTQPTLVLGDVRVILQGLTEIRVERMLWKDSHYDDGKDQVASVLFRGQGEPAKRDPLPLNGTETLIARNWAFSDTHMMSNMVPDFRTWTMIHAHRIKVELEIVHVESGHVFKLEGKWPCQILPEGEVQVVPQAQSIQAEAAAGLVDEGEQLPAYSPAGPSSAPPPPATPPPGIDEKHLEARTEPEE